MSNGETILLKLKCDKPHLRRSQTMVAPAVNHLVDEREVVENDAQSKNTTKDKDVSL